MLAVNVTSFWIWVLGVGTKVSIDPSLGAPKYMKWKWLSPMKGIEAWWKANNYVNFRLRVNVIICYQFLIEFWITSDIDINPDFQKSDTFTQVSQHSLKF